LNFSLTKAMSDIAAEAVVDKENRANLVSAEPAPQKAALPVDQVRVGTPQGCAGAGRDRMVRLHARRKTKGVGVATFPAARGAGMQARCWPLVGACTR
jgi:hypothetical protein